jgi:hypothetical protein
MVCSRAPEPTTKIFTRLPYSGGLASVWQMALKRIAQSDGQAALLAWAGGTASAEDEARATRYCLQLLRDAAPGKSVEVRVPPYGAAQVIEGPHHTRGTPPAVIEMEPETWLRLATGAEGFAEAKGQGAVSASGERADLTAWLPLTRLP